MKSQELMRNQEGTGQLEKQMQDFRDYVGFVVSRTYVI